MASSMDKSRSPDYGAELREFVFGMALLYPAGLQTAAISWADWVRTSSAFYAQLAERCVQVLRYPSRSDALISTAITEVKEYVRTAAQIPEQAVLRFNETFETLRRNAAQEPPAPVPADPRKVAGLLEQVVRRLNAVSEASVEQAAKLGKRLEETKADSSRLTPEEKARAEREATELDALRRTLVMLGAITTEIERLTT